MEEDQSNDHRDDFMISFHKIRWWSWDLNLRLLDLQLDAIPTVLWSPTNLNCQSQQLLSALSSACDFKSHFCKQCGPRSGCFSRSSLIRVHTVCLYAKIDLKSLQDKCRQHKQTTFSDAGFFGISTHCSRETPQRVIGKQCRPRSDAAEHSV